MNRLVEKIPVNILVTLLLLIYLTVITYGLVNDKQNLVIAASSLALLPIALFFFVIHFISPDRTVNQAMPSHPPDKLIYAF